LELHPDHFKLLILQGFAIHVNENAETLRGLFVAHEGKKKIEIRRDDFVKGSPNNPWTEVFDQFASKISNDLNDKELVGLVQGPLSTSTPTTVASFNVSLMDAMQQYFEYKMYTKCGIPFVELKGTPNDWQSLITLVNCIEKYDLTWWTNEIRPILETIVSTVSQYDQVDKEFWGNIIKKDGGSGGPYFDGWLCKFFPYIGSQKYRRNTFKPITTVPSGISCAPVSWNYLGTEFTMKFSAGFYGWSYVNDAFRPEISWVVYEDIVKPVLTNLQKEILEVYKHGKYHMNSKTCYYNAGTVSCDLCRRQFAKKNDPVIHYGQRDLCMKCVEVVRDTLAK
jgi:hypothetical protein